MRKVLMVLVAAALAAVAVPSFGRDTGALGAYSGRGNVDYLSPANPGSSARGTVTLGPVAARGPSVVFQAPGRGTVSLSATIRQSFYPPSIVPAGLQCPVTNSTGTMFIAWSDGTSSTGTATMIVAGRTVTVHGTIKTGRFRGGLLEVAASVTVAPGPPDCDASFSGLAAFAYPPSI